MFSLLKLRTISLVHALCMYRTVRYIYVSVRAIRASARQTVFIAFDFIVVFVRKYIIKNTSKHLNYVIQYRIFPFWIRCWCMWVSMYFVDDRNSRISRDICAINLIESHSTDILKRPSQQKAIIKNKIKMNKTSHYSTQLKRIVNRLCCDLPLCYSF